MISASPLICFQKPPLPLNHLADSFYVLRHFFHILAPLNEDAFAAVFRRLAADLLGDTPRPQRQDSLFLLHYYSKEPIMEYYRLFDHLCKIPKMYYQVLLSAFNSSFVAVVLHLRFFCCTRLAQRPSRNTIIISSFIVLSKDYLDSFIKNLSRTSFHLFHTDTHFC